MNNDQLMLKVTEEMGWACFIDKDLTTERKNKISELLGERDDWKTRRDFIYKWINERWDNDNIVLYLFSNGMCAIFLEKGNFEHINNDHRVGVYEENSDEIKVKTISYWRDDLTLTEEIFIK